MRIGLIGYEANVKNRVGSNQYAYELIKALYRLDDKNDYTVFLPVSPLQDLPKEKDNWHYKVIGPRRLWNLTGLPAALLQKPKLDVVFNPGHYSPIVCPYPLVVSIMDLGFLRFPKQFTRPIFLKLKFWTGISVRRATHVLAISSSTKKDIIKNYRLSDKKVTVTYPGYDRNRFREDIEKEKVEKVRKKYYLGKEYVLFLSTLKPSKNLPGLLKAFSLLGKDYPDLALVVGGRKGWLYEQIDKVVKDLGVEDKVTFSGFVAEEDLPALMKGARVFCLPSFWEGFGIPVVEAMACGTPVVVSNAGSLPEVVGKAGVIVDPYKPEDIARGLKRALKKPKFWAKKGLQKANDFSWEKCAEQTLSVLEKVAKKG